MPMPGSTPAISSASARLAMTATPSAAASCACRPTTVERTSSARPVSSSVRVCRAMVSTLIMPTSTAMKPSIWWPSMEPKL
jgi:hypothetical protein